MTRNQMKKNNPETTDEIIDWIRNYCNSILNTEGMLYNKKIPEDFLSEAGKRCLFGIRLPTEYGGLNLPMSDTVKIVEQLAAIDINLATYLIVQHTFSYPILLFAKPQFRGFYLPQIAAGNNLGCFALSEPEAGSNPRKMRTSIVPAGRGRWKINGTKCWITGAASADMFLVFGRHPEDSGYKGISCFAIPRRTVGINVEEPKEMLSINGVGLRSITFKDVEVGEEYLIGELGKGMVVAESGLLFGRFFTTAICTGIMKRCSQFMLRYASQRNIGSGMLVDNPVTISRLREIDKAVGAIEALGFFIAEKIDCNEEIPEDIAIACKVCSSELAWESADKLVQLLGARGLDERNFTSQILRDTRFFRIGEGPSEPLLVKLGATLSLTNSKLMRYIREEMKAKEAYEHLVTDINQIKKMMKEMSVNKEIKSIFYYAIGKVGMWSVLEAGLMYRYNIKSNTNLYQVIEWVRCKSDQVLCEVKCDINNVCKETTPFDFNTEPYEYSIGTIDETMPKTRERLDEFLKNPYEYSTKLKCDESSNYATVIDLFEQNVKKNSQSNAVISPSHTISYAKLNHEINKVCNILNEKGVAPGDVVGLIMDRTPLLIISILAVLKSGSTILMLNAQEPKKRNQLILKKANAKTILSVCQLKEYTSDIFDNVLYIDSEIESSSENAEEFHNKANPFTIAYIAFTSGSTGVPKGVRVTHKAICSQILARLDSAEISFGDRILHSVAPNFDIAIWELLGPFVYGSSIVLSNEKVFNWEPRKIIDLIIKYEVTHMQITPTQLELVLTNLPSNCDSKLKCIFCGGEVLPDNVKDQFRKKLPKVELIHMYGPTEAVIDTCYCKPLTEKDYSLGEIGLPFLNKRVYILDEDGKIVPPNTPGELYIGGDIAEDYLDEPYLTEKSFIKDIFSNSPNAKMYKSGDIVTKLSSGRFKFLGRQDQQIKINGVRIESGEIETVLEKYPNIKQLKVVLQKAKENEKLVAYYVLDKQGSLNEQELRDFASQHLSRVMVPSNFIQLEEFPVTGTGKINLSSLPETVDINTKEMLGKEEKENPIFESIVQVWEDVLECKVNNDTSDFFEMGGNSLMAIQVLTRIWEIYAVEIDVIDFYEDPTIKGLVQRIFAQQKKAPLAGTQKNYWYLYKMDMESAAYNCPEAVYFKGELNVEFLEWSIAKIISRHEALRTIFVDDEGEPFQTVLETKKYMLPVVDITRADKKAQEAELLKLLEVEASRPFNLSEVPPFAAKLFKLNMVEYVFFWNFHHIIADGWSSAQVFTSELNELYQSRCESREPVLPKLRMQPIDYMEWQEKKHTPEIMDKQRTYWLEELEGVPSEVDLTLGNKFALSKGGIKGRRISFEIPETLYKLLKEFSIRQGLSTYNVLVTAFAALTHVLSGSNDISIGTVVAGRKNSEVEHVMGNFANVVVLRCIFEPESTVEMVLRQMKNKLLNALRYSDIPFEEVVSALKPNREKNKNPLFNIFFSLFNGNEVNLDFENLESKPIPMDPAIARFDFSVAMFEVNQKLNGYVEYKVDLFEERTIKRIIKYFIKMLSYVIAFPSQYVDSAELVDNEEKKLLCQTWNDCHTPFPRDLCMHQMFEQQVIRVPDKIAVFFENKSLTYFELNCRANKLANYLRRGNIQTGDFVGICVKSSIEMIVGILGIVKAGAAYVPIDPVLPKKRVEFILNEIDSKLIVTQCEFAKTLFENEEIVCLDKDWEIINKESDENLNLSMKSNQIIYMIFTSGSTGVPKAVRTMHYNVAALLCNSNHMQVSENDRILKVNNFAFDISTWEIWSPLINGAIMIGMPDEIKLKPIQFAEFVDKNQISMAYLPTAIFHAISVEVPSAFRKMKYLIVGGEALDPTRARAVLEDNPPEVFVNALGPTEVTCSAVWYNVRNLPKDAITVPIGGPISNTQLYVLNSQMRVLPIGVTGELYIGGAGVSDGYHNRHELTKRNFIHNPFDHDEKFCRLYRSGDLVKYQEDGNLIYMGRKDHQIKLRGFRIEIGEIENAIREYEAINTVAVLVKGSHVDDKQLVAFVSLKSGFDDTCVDSIKNYLKERLPYYMVPAVLKVLDALPYNKNGKIDRKELSEIDVFVNDTKSNIMYPRNTEEAQIAKIWEEVIGFKAPGIQSDFFESGGDSLKAVRLLTVINQEFSINLPMETLYDHGTIESLSIMIRKENISLHNTALIPFNHKKATNRSLFLVHPLSGSALCYSQLANLIDYPVFGLQQLGNKELKDAGVNSIEKLAEYYLKSVYTIQNKGQYLLGGWSLGGLISFEMARQLEHEGQLVEKIILFDSAAPGTHQKSLDMRAILKLCLEEAAEQYGASIDLDLNQIDTADSDAMYQMVLKQLKLNKVISEDADIDELKELVEICTSNIRMLNSYDGGKVNCNIVLIHPNHHIPYSKNVENEEKYLDWMNYTNGSVELIEVDGSHMSMIFEPYVKSLVKVVQGCLK
ncbi:non-ribosomal peptide synthetase [Anaerosacchariphilus polymeriproducens]|uniref:Amino acid adenylation domain-containing protein n=1 Tax=Anaerosacchariphilus polymeriproducens TaxID=1812858 RepID=A0A371AYM4_9FIRM|nr:non-ribosomal peptide synthetase [Anaerosacchariphilus polymeriproducens]RDU24661.1 amino acid adenylation domain-containing protein [Anaerosacchariphilus polymeriproducens]